MLSPIVGSATSEMCYSLGHVKVMSIFLWQSESLSWGGIVRGDRDRKSRAHIFSDYKMSSQG